jgi:hypothetical protein
MRSHHFRAVLAVPAALGVLLAGALVAVTSGPGMAGAGRPTAPGAAAPATLPAGATPVTVDEGLSTTGIDAQLIPAASISGSFMSSTGKALTGEVDAYLDGKLAATGFAFNGHYEINGLFAASFAVCAPRTSIGTGTGFLGRCWQNAPFSGTVPGGATLVTLADAEQRTGIDLTLPPGAAIAGTVTTPGGVAVSSAGVLVHNLSTGADYTTLTVSGGAYEIQGLPRSAKGYRVCFRPQTGGPGTGFLPQCYKNKSWSGGRFPSSVTPVSVTIGKVHRHIDQTLPPGGAVKGTVTDSGTGDNIRGAIVSVYSAKGKLLGSASSRHTGHYRIQALPAATGDHVCVHPLVRAPKPSYHGLCWRHAAWNGGRLPSRAAPVRVRTSSTHTGLDLHLRRAANDATASIAGTVTQQSDGTPVEGAIVYLFQNGSRVRDKPTNASGQYAFSNLRAATGLTICVLAVHATAAVRPDTGWAPRCYGDVPWDGLQVPDTATGFSLTTGQTLTGIDVALHPGGAIDGTVYELDGVTPVSDVTVDVFTTAGDLVTFEFSRGDGTYRIDELIPADYVVCFDGRYTGGIGSHAPQCFDSVAWDGD